MLAEIDPKPPVPTRIAPAGPRRGTIRDLMRSLAGPVRSLPAGARPGDWIEPPPPANAGAASEVADPEQARELAEAEAALDRAWLAKQQARAERPLRFRVQFTAEQEYVDLLEEAFDLLGVRQRAASLPELQLRALREFVERLRQRRTGTKRRVRQPAASSDATCLPPSTGHDAAPARELGGGELKPAWEVGHPKSAPERERRDANSSPERGCGDADAAPTRELGGDELKPAREVGHPKSAPERERRDANSSPERGCGDADAAPARERSGDELKPAPKVGHPKSAPGHDAAPARELGGGELKPAWEVGHPKSAPARERRGVNRSRERGCGDADAAPARERRDLISAPERERRDSSGALTLDAAPARGSAAPARRHVSVAVRREVWARDAGRCAYTDDRGRRCAETRGLELHHREAHALGGPDTVANLELRCGAHNLLAAEQDFGRTHMDWRRGKAPQDRAGAVRSSELDEASFP